MNFIIVDDESAAHEIIEDFAKEIPFLRKVANCFHAIDALEILQKKKVDLIFLDINMPRINGFEFLRTLKISPAIIVTSAHQEYALEGYELEVKDYLLKPFSFTRFLKAIQRVQEDSLPQNANATITGGKIFIKSERRHHQINLSDLLYIEAKGNYIQLQTKSERLLSYMSLSDIIKSLPEDQFIRVHKSFIVSIPALSSVEGNTIFMNEFSIPIGQSFKKYTLSKLGLNN